MANEMMTAESNGGMLVTADLGTAKYYNDAAFEELVSAGSYLPRVQLFGGNSDAVKEGKMQVGHYGLVQDRDRIIDLGTSVDLIPLSLRFAAMRLDESNVIAVFNHEDPEFKRIVADSDEPDSRCMYGPQFLLYLPTQKVFATFLFGSKTSRREGRNMKPLICKGATLKAKLVKNNKYMWHTPIVVPCSATLQPPEDLEVMKRVADKFNNPEESQVEFDTSKLEAAATGTPERPR